MIRTRFAPSPTGFLHVGGLRTALFCYLYAKKNGGQFLLRIEDTDQERFVEGAVESMITSLKWAGITIDEGVRLDDGGHVVQTGDHGPYIQSERLDLYKKHMQALLEKDAAYYCFCTRERLDELRKIQEANKQPTGYDGHCRTLSKEDVKQHLEAGEAYVVRLKVQKDASTSFTDLVRGTVTFDNSQIDDQVLMKSDGFPTYHLASVVDDHLMEITHVVRGEEWLPSTPKHVLLYEAFGWEAPVFAHLSLLVNEQKQKLSKRHGDVSVEDFKEKGYVPEALVNFIAFLGWNPGDERELFTLEELEKEFAFDHVSKAAAVFNREKLDWYNKEYLKQMSLEEVTKRALPFLINDGVIDSEQFIMNNEKFEWLQQVISLEKERMTTLSELPEAVGFIFADTLVYDAELVIWKKSTRDDAKDKLTQLKTYLNTISEEDWNLETLEEEIKRWISQREYGVGDVLWPMRTSLSGQKNSPGPFEIAAVLGKEKTLKRIGEAVEKL